MDIFKEVLNVGLGALIGFTAGALIPILASSMAPLPMPEDYYTELPLKQAVFLAPLGAIIGACVVIF